MKTKKKRSRPERVALLCVAALFVLVLVGAFGRSSKTEAQEPVFVSLVQLIAMPETFERKLVRVVGFCRLEFDVEALYLHREDLVAALTKNSVRLILDSFDPGGASSFMDEYVVVEGVFESPTPGENYAGRLHSISRLELYPSRNELSPPR